VSGLVQRVDEARKAVAAFVVPALVALGSALLAGSDGGSGVSAAEWVTVVVAGLGTSGIVYEVRNARSDDSGHVDGVTAVLGVVIVAAGVVLGTLLLRLL
jgi:hypothetical protein